MQDRCQHHGLVFQTWRRTPSNREQDFCVSVYMDALMQRSFFVSRPTGLYRSKFKNAIHFLLGCKQSEKEERRDGSMESQYYTQTPQQVLHAMESREEGLTT